MNHGDATTAPPAPTESTRKELQAYGCKARSRASDERKRHWSQFQVWVWRSVCFFVLSLCAGAAGIYAGLEGTKFILSPMSVGSLAVSLAFHLCNGWCVKRYEHHRDAVKEIGEIIHAIDSVMDAKKFNRLQSLEARLDGLSGGVA